MSVLYSAGRWAEQMENVDDRPYWMYTGINDSHTRKSHLALHGLVLRYDDPFWQAFYPPNGWRCRCGVIALSAADVRARGLKVSDSGSAMGWELKLVSEKQARCRTSPPSIPAPRRWPPTSAGLTRRGQHTVPTLPAIRVRFNRWHSRN
jgi:hypothetical protein